MTDPKYTSIGAQICQPMTSSPWAQEQCQAKAEAVLSNAKREFCKPDDVKTDAAMVQCFQKEADKWVGEGKATRTDSSGNEETIATFSNRIIWKYMSFVDRKIPRIPDINDLYEDVIGKFVENKSVLNAYGELAKMGLDDIGLTVKENGAEKTVIDPNEKAVIMWMRLQNEIKKNENPQTKDKDKVKVSWSYKDLATGKSEATTVTLGHITSDMDYKQISDMAKAYVVYMQKEMIGLLTLQRVSYSKNNQAADVTKCQEKIDALAKWDYQFPYKEAGMVKMLETEFKAVREAYYYILQSKMPNDDQGKQKQLIIETKDVKYGSDGKDFAGSYVVTGKAPTSLKDMMDANTVLLAQIRAAAKTGGVDVPVEPGEGGSKVVTGQIAGEYGSGGSFASNLFGDLNINILEKNGWKLGARITALYLDLHPGFVHADGPISDADDVTNPDPSLQLVYMYLEGSYKFKSGIKLYGKAGVLDNRNRTTPWMAFDRLHHSNGEGGQIIGRDTGLRVGIDIPLGDDAKAKNHIAVEASIGGHGNPVLWKSGKKPNTFWFDESQGKGQFVHTGLLKVYKPEPGDGQYDHIVDAYNAKLGYVVTGDGLYHVNGILEGKFNLIPKSRILQVGAGAYLGFGDGLLDWGVGGMVTINPLGWLAFHLPVAYGDGYRTFNMGKMDTPNGPENVQTELSTKQLSLGAQAHIGPFEGIPVLDSMKFFLMYEAANGNTAETHGAGVGNGKWQHSILLGGELNF